MGRGDTTGVRSWGGFAVSIGGLAAAAALGTNLYYRTYDSARADITRVEVVELINAHSTGIDARIDRLEILVSASNGYAPKFAAIGARVGELANQITVLREQLESKTRNRITSKEHLHIEKRFVADIIRIQGELNALRAWIRTLK